jgi:hypothetical protein
VHHALENIVTKKKENRVRIARFLVFHGLALKFIRGWLAKRFTFTLDVWNMSVILSVVMTQWLNGVTSLIPKTKGLHIILVEFDDISLQKVIEALITVQDDYGLSNWYVFSDKEGSYRAFCFTIVTFPLLMHILVDTNYVDKVYVGYTWNRGKATLRTSRKWGRLAKQELVAFVESFFEPVPKPYERVLYQTGITKKGIEFHLGEKRDEVNF